ncbi:MAG: hypothetical protein E6826_06455 [Anaerococcus vaginalis]|nr:hypothetical protein [Anaerococcus vaginalis]
MKIKKNKKIILTLLLAIILLGTNIALASYTKRDDDSDDIYIDKINESIVKKPTELNEGEDIKKQLEGDVIEDVAQDKEYYEQLEFAWR